MSKTYRIGEVLTSNKDIVIERALSGEKVIVPKGSRVIIGADKLAHHFRDDSIQPLSANATVNGFSAEGIAEYLYDRLRRHLAIDTMLDDYDNSPEDFKEEIVEALEEIGFYEDN